MKSNWRNQWCPLPSIHMLDSRVTAPIPLLVGPSWAVQVWSTFHVLPSPQVKRKHTHSNPSAISGVQEVRLPPDMITLCFQSLALHYGR